jgi:hypothetical protein
MYQNRFKTNEEKIAYIMGGAGDEVPNSLTQLDIKYTIKADEITPKKLENFDVVMTGVRAYNTINALVNKQAILLIL